ncbi:MULTISPECIES: hypothetical protein [unclassified Pseudomonas]|uniref:hypothetical protein n=1 Tax=unclassified Pseudomonas TaxID=196821 RepID=UPI001472FD05|nr:MULTISPECIES: hypothetical protein [unclassified Pseudomonas]NMX92047.1 hypothetical protein [Pseudomonas sp. WS 5086]NMY46871.1 hypothetical protein [Pseudomonas sp. WS 5027]
MSKVIQSVEELDAVLHWRGKHAIAVRERDGLQLSLNTADQTIDDLSAAVSRRTKRVRELEARLAYAVDALNEVVKASAIYEKPFEIATLAIGEISVMAEQPAPVEVVPDGYCIMPRQLTAENGAKALLLGEFKLLVTKECPECCELEEPTEGCSICDGEGEYGQKHTIPWDQIKFIYSKAVSGLAVNAESAKT